MIDKELRLKALSMLYQNDMQGKPVPGDINDLEGMSLDEYHRASLYLVNHNLAEGHSTSTGEGYRVWANHVTGRGMDIIEKLIDKSIEQVEENRISFTHKLSPYLEKLLELIVIWSEHPNLYQQAWDNLTQLIS